jgi:hypothetical protein
MHVNATLALPLVSVALAAPDRGGGGRAINALETNARLEASPLPLPEVPVPPVVTVGSGAISFALFSAAIRAANRDDARLNPESVRD